jgi:hypothetical protein
MVNFEIRQRTAALALWAVYRQSVSYHLGNNPEQARLVWKDHYRHVG